MCSIRFTFVFMFWWHPFQDIHPLAPARLLLRPVVLVSSLLSVGDCFCLQCQESPIPHHVSSSFLGLLLPFGETSSGSSWRRATNPWTSFLCLCQLPRKFHLVCGCKSFHWCGLVTELCPALVTPWTVARHGNPWDFPGKNMGVGCQFFLQEIFLIQGSNLSPALQCRAVLSCVWLSDHMDSSPCCRWILYHWATGEPIFAVTTLKFLLLAQTFSEIQS